MANDKMIIYDSLNVSHSTYNRGPNWAGSLWFHTKHHQTKTHKLWHCTHPASYFCSGSVSTDILPLCLILFDQVFVFFSARLICTALAAIRRYNSVSTSSETMVPSVIAARLCGATIGHHKMSVLQKWSPFIKSIQNVLSSGSGRMNTFEHTIYSAL